MSVKVFIGRKFSGAANIVNLRIPNKSVIEHNVFFKISSGKLRVNAKLIKNICIKNNMNPRNFNVDSKLFKPFTRVSNLVYRENHKEAKLSPKM